MGNLITSLYCMSSGVDLISNDVILKNRTSNAKLKMRMYGFNVDTSSVVFGKKKLKNNTLAKVQFLNDVPMCVVLDESWWNFESQMQEKILIHELLHVFDRNIVDLAYMHQKKFKNLTFAEHIHNADSLTRLISYAK